MESSSLTSPHPASASRASSKGSGAEWLAPFTGVAFFLVGIAAFVVGGQPKSADKPAREVVDYYLNHETRVEVSAALGIVAAALLVFFGAYLRKVLREAAGEGEMLSLVSFIGVGFVAFGFAIDGTIAFALADRANDVPPAAVQALQALYDDDFIPMVLGVALFLLATGISALRSRALPKWLGWIMVVLGVVTFTPVGFVSALAAALMVLGLGIVLTMRVRAA
jgi:hypothetical protein